LTKQAAIFVQLRKPNPNTNSRTNPDTNSSLNPNPSPNLNPIAIENFCTIRQMLRRW